VTDVEVQYAPRFGEVVMISTGRHRGTLGRYTADVLPGVTGGAPTYYVVRDDEGHEHRATAISAVRCWSCGERAEHDTTTCCSSHERTLCHACYRRTHFVEVCGCGREACKREG
jgi:hypothetical protein